jgi:hypothetical protein
MNYNRNYVKDLPYFPFTPVLMMARNRAVFLFSQGSMNDFWLAPFIENTRLLQIVSDEFLARLPQLERLEVIDLK